LGKSCHCAPVRKIQRTPLSTTRVSFHGLPSNGTLTSNGIDCDTVPLNSSTCNSLGIAVISLLLSATCVAQYQILCCPGAHHVHNGFPACREPRMALPSMLTTSASLSWTMAVSRPQNMLQLFRINRGKYPVESVVRRNAAGQPEKLLQPTPVGLP
jgi:hypothetical protein